MQQNLAITDFTDYSTENGKKLRSLALKYPKAHFLFLFLLGEMKTSNSQAILCSISIFEELLETSRQTVSNAIKILKNLGFVKVLKSGTSNIYIL